MSRLNRALGSVFLLFMLAGCGGSGSQHVPDGTRAGGTVRFTITWPPQATSRLVPKLTKSIKVVVRSKRPYKSDPITTQFVNRQEGQNQATIEVRNLPSVTVEFTVTAHPNPGGTGGAMAKAMMDADIRENETISRAITMDTAISFFRITPNPFYVRPGESGTATAEPVNSEGVVTMVPEDKITWSVDKPTVASIQANGLSCVVTGKSKPGTVQLTITDSESGKSTVTTAYILDPTRLEEGAWANTSHVWVFESGLGSSRQSRGLEVEIVSLPNGDQVIRMYQPTKPIKTLVAEVPVTTSDGQHFQAGGIVPDGMFLAKYQLQVSGYLSYSEPNYGVLYFYWQAFGAERIYGEGEVFTR